MKKIVVSKARLERILRHQAELRPAIGSPQQTNQAKFTQLPSRENCPDNGFQSHRQEGGSHEPA